MSCTSLTKACNHVFYNVLICVEHKTRSHYIGNIEVGLGSFFVVVSKCIRVISEVPTFDFSVYNLPSVCSSNFWVSVAGHSCSVTF